MAFSDEELLLEYAGDAESLAWAQKTLSEFGDAFRYQLIMAMHLQAQAAHLEELRAAGTLGRFGEERYSEGYVEALRHTARGLRSGDFLPGGTAHDDTIAGEAF
jgi:hypothetical protein